MCLDRRTDVLVGWLVGWLVGYPLEYLRKAFKMSLPGIPEKNSSDSS